VDNGFYRRIDPIYVQMPTAEDRREMIRRFFLQKDSFITTDGMKKIADLLEGACFDDVNTFLGTMESVNGTKMTVESSHFRQTYSEDGNQDWCACMPNDPRAEARTSDGITCVGMPITPRDISKAFHGTKKSKPFKRTVQQEDIDQFEQFYKEGKRAVKVKTDIKDQIVPDHVITSGKFKPDNRKKGTVTGFKYFDY